LDDEHPELINKPAVKSIATEREQNLATGIEQLHYPLFLKSEPYNTKLPKKKPQLFTAITPKIFQCLCMIPDTSEWTPQIQ
jgi:hypothetical protein